jgi:hypothetical protein
MSVSRTALKSLAAWIVLQAGCTFEDPNAPPPPDDCIKRYPGTPEKELWTGIDGPAACAGTNPARSDVIDGDTIVHFTGSGWNEQSAHCRGIDLFLGATPVMNLDNDLDGVPDVVIKRNAEVPLDAIGYCLVNGGTPSEQVEYSVCGLQTAGKGACEQTLVQQGNAEITAEWFNCPGAEFCAPASEDACLKEAGDGRVYAAYVDDPDFFCEGTPNAGSLTDVQDTLLVITGTRYKQSSAICIATSTYDSKAGLAFGIGSMSRISQRVMDGTREPQLPVLDPERHPVPNGKADGYCLFNEGTAEEFVLYSMCNGQPETDPDAEPLDGGAPAPFEPTFDLTRKERCIGATLQMQDDGTSKEVSLWGVKVPSPRKGKWFDCPGSELCNLPTK